MLLRTSLLVLSFLVQKVVLQNTFLHSCNDAQVLNHINTFGHTYCSHACGAFTQMDEENRCDPATGNCICTSPCYNGTVAPAPPTYPSDVCPPQPSFPPDPNTNRPAECIQSCASQCPGGTGEVCSEVTGFPDATGAITIFATICRCVCPAQPCTSSSSSTTSIALPIYSYILKIKKKKTLLIKKILLCCIILFKLFFTKAIIMSVYYFIFREFIDADIRSLFSGYRTNYEYDYDYSNEFK